MSKATSNISRRTVITTAIAAPAFTIPNILHTAAAAPGHPDAALFMLEEKCVAARAHSEIVGKRHTTAESAMIEWKRLNPEPAFPASSNPEAEKLMEQVLLFVEGGGMPSEFVAPPLTALTDDAQASFREMSDALQLRVRWADAKRAANLPYDEIEAEWHASTNAIAELLEEVADFQATTLDGLKCKARLYEVDVDMADDVGLADSIAHDLLAMASG